MVKVLQFVYKMQLAGAETLLMQIYRAIDRNKVQFDFVTHTDETGNYDNEICEFGGKIFICRSCLAKFLALCSSVKKKNRFAKWAVCLCTFTSIVLEWSCFGSCASIDVPIASKPCSQHQ